MSSEQQPAVHGANSDDAVVQEARAQLTDVEATAVSVSKFRVAGASLRRPDGSPFFDASFDAQLCNAVLPQEEQAALLGLFQDHMVAVLAMRTAEIDEHALERLRAAGWDPAQPSVFVMEGLIGYLTAAVPPPALLRRARQPPGAHHAALRRLARRAAAHARGPAAPHHIRGAGADAGQGCGCGLVGR
eukprot:XP_001697309.1 predicted protein [Chlamydomonas reinhardtii]